MSARNPTVRVYEWLEKPGGVDSLTWRLFASRLFLRYAERREEQGNYDLLKYFNRKLNQIESRLGCARLFSLPSLLRIGVTRRCNLRCRTCGVGNRTEKEEKAYDREARMDLSLDDYKMLAAEVFPYVENIEFNQNGEAFLLGDPFLEMLDLADGYDVGVTVSTNGMLLNRRILSRILSLKHLRCLIFSMDGSQKETLEDIRVGSNYERIVRNIRLSSSLRAKRKHPRLQIHFTAMRSNIHELPSLVDLAAGIGVDVVSVSYLYLNPFLPVEQSLYFSKEVANATFLEAKRRGDEKKIDVWLPPLFGDRVRSSSRCGLPWNGPSVVPGGYILPCCMLFTQNHHMGNVRDGFRRVWNNERFQRLRRSLAVDDPIIDKCRCCNHHNQRFDPDVLKFHATEEMMEVVSRRTTS